MDEYLTDEQKWVSEDNRLSFRGFMRRNVYERIDNDLRIVPEQWVFPDPLDLGSVQRFIDKVGGVDIAFGGIGINGHIAFNEAEDHTLVEAFAKRETRIITMSHETRCANAIGDLGSHRRHAPLRRLHRHEANPRRQTGAARSLPDWHRAVLRQAIFGDVSAHFPVTLLQKHPDAIIMTNANAAKRPF